MDPSSSASRSSTSASWAPGTDLSLHLWTALAALAIAVPVQAWRLNRRKRIPCALQQQQHQHQPQQQRQHALSIPSPLVPPVLNTIDEEEDPPEVSPERCSPLHRESDISPDRQQTPKTKRSRDRRKRGPNLLKERSSRARQRVASWSLAAASEVDKSAHAVTTLEKPTALTPGVPDSSDTFQSSPQSETKNASKNKEQRKKRDTSTCSSSRTGTDSLYGDIEEAPSETASHIQDEHCPDQLSVARAPSASTSASNCDSCPDNISTTSNSLSVPSSTDTPATSSSKHLHSFRALPGNDPKGAIPPARAALDPTPVQSESRNSYAATPGSSHKSYGKLPLDERRPSPIPAEPLPYYSHSQDASSQDTTSSGSPSRNFSPAPVLHKEKDTGTVLYDSASSAYHTITGPSAGPMSDVALTTQISSLRGALSASRQREEALKAQCARLTAELQEARWRLNVWSQSQAHNPTWVQPSGPLPVWGYGSTPNSASHSHPMSPMTPGYQGAFPVPNWAMSPLRNIQTKDRASEHPDDDDEDEDDRLEKSPIAEAILKRPGSFSRSRSRSSMLNEETHTKETHTEEQQSVENDPTAVDNRPAPSSADDVQTDVVAPQTEVPTSDGSNKPFLEDIVFPSLLGS